MDGRHVTMSGLVAVGRDGGLLPSAAWHWRSDIAARHWSFYLRADLCCPESGSRVTAHTFERLWQETAGLPTAQCRAVDAWKLVILLARRDPELPAQLAVSRLKRAVVVPGTPDLADRVASVQGLIHD